VGAISCKAAPQPPAAAAATAAVAVAATAAAAAAQLPQRLLQQAVGRNCIKYRLVDVFAGVVASFVLVSV